MDQTDLERALSEHPCFCEGAHLKFARMHIPVAPRCNIQCNYCNRKFDCCNESRPGVTSEVLTPEESIAKISVVLEKIPQLKVIGIAGPGDPLANEETFRSLELIKDAYPYLTPCVSTNGLALPDNAERLYNLGVRFITVTMNCMNPEIGSKIYDSVIFNGKRYTGTEGATILRDRQFEGIEACVRLGMKVKINIVMIPGVNDGHIPELVKKVKGMGAYIVNILPLIPIEGTAFSGMRAPTPQERKDMMGRCSLDSRMMRHCRQCRADAIGLLGEDRSSEFAHVGCGLRSMDDAPSFVTGEINRDEFKVAVASSDGTNVDSGFGNASRFMLYATDGDTYRYLETVDIDTSSSVSGKDHVDHVADIIGRLKDCSTVIVEEVGPLPTKMLSKAGIKVVISHEAVGDAIRNSKS